MLENMDELTAFGAPYFERKGEIERKVKSTDDSHPLEFMGKYQKIPVIEVRIDLPVYRLNNGRTKSFQKEYLATHQDVEKDIFTKDHDSIKAQKVQHVILMKLVDEKDLYRSFRKDDLQQAEPIISTNDGVIVNGNRRLCAWRELYHSDKKKYKYFETIKLAILPDCDERAIRDLERRLQVQNTMKAEYHWHTLALMVSEEIEQGLSTKSVAELFGKSIQQINTMIDCRVYAETYLKSIGKHEQWSFVDNDMYAFEQMVKGRKRLDSSGKKELFESLAFIFIESSTDEGRLYGLIPNIAENIDPIINSFKEKLDISMDEYLSDEILLLSGDDEATLEISGVITKKIKEIDDQDFIRKTIISVIDTQKKLKQEQNAENFLLNKVTEAATSLTEAASLGLGSKNIKTKGIEAQLTTIKKKVSTIEKWLEKTNGNKN